MYDEKSLTNNKKKRKNREKQIFSMKDIQPLTDNQEKIFDAFEDENIDCSIVHGYPGTGKTFISLYLALNELDISPIVYHKILIIRSSVSGRAIGFLPGKPKEKMEEYETAYSDIVNDLYDRGDAWLTLKNKGQIEFTSTSFLRGKTFDNTIVILDEFQNLSFQELHTVITRVGKDTKLILIGDSGQDDLTSERYKEESGASKILSVLSTMPNVSMIEMNADDIVRSGFVKNYILALYNI